MAQKNKKKRVKQKRESKIAAFFSGFSLTKKTKRGLLIMFGIGILLFIAFLVTDAANTEYLWMFFAFPMAICLFFPIGISLILNEKHKVRNLFILIAFVFIGILFKRMRLPGAGVILSMTLITMGCGYLFLTFKNYFSIKNNTYLRIVGTIAALILTLMSTGMVFKFQHWPGAGAMITLSLLPSLIFTMLVLVTLPGSGYIKWKKEHKQMFSKTLLIPWMFFLLFTASSFLMPKTFGKLLAFNGPIETNSKPFQMDAYEIEPAEGMETGQ